MESKPGQSKSFMLHLEKIAAYSLGEQDEINQKRRRPRSFYVKKFGEEDGEEIFRSYLFGYDTRHKYREAAEKSEEEFKNKRRKT